MTANWSKSNRSWRGRDRQRLGLAKHGGLLAQVFDGEHPRTAAVALLLLASLHLYLAGLFQRHAPEPYMDEYFHEKQTRAFCNGQWGTWDPKITTPPGLYLVGTAVLWAVGKAQALLHGDASPAAAAAICAPGQPILPYLRPINAAFNLGTFLLVYRLMYRTRKLTHGEAVGQALLVLLYPIIFFFGFLYYTDAGSLFFVVAMLVLARRGRHGLAAAMGGCALLFRQTNAVWVAYAAGTSIVADLQQGVMKKGPSAGLPDPSEPLSLPLLARFGAYMWRSRIRLLRAIVWPYLLPLAGFAAFLVWNKGRIVLGDPEHHAPVLHAAQLAYWLLVTALTHHPLLPLDPEAWYGLLVWARRECGLARFALLLGGAALALHKGTLAHPFLLADNRHYTFYLWRRGFVRAPHLNLYLLPLYALAAHWVLSRAYQGANPNGAGSSFVILGLSGNNSLTAAILALAAALVVLPAHLLEPRYWTTPLVVALLEMPPSSPGDQNLATLAFAALNLVTVHVFLHHPFKWEDGTVARFMW